MSNSRRARGHLNGSRNHLGPDEELGVVCGWAGDNENIELAKKQTHDTLIALMGASRTGGVSWRIVKTARRAIPVLDRMREGASDELLDVYDKIAELLNEYGGALVMATALGRPGWSFQPPRSGD